jgi:hypothetical protein
MRGRNKDLRKRMAGSLHSIGQSSLYISYDWNYSVAIASFTLLYLFGTSSLLLDSIIPVDQNHDSSARAQNPMYSYLGADRSSDRLICDPGVSSDLLFQ